MLLLLDNYAWRLARANPEQSVLDFQDADSGVVVRLMLTEETRRKLRDKLSDLEVASPEDLRKATKGLAVPLRRDGR